MYDINKTIKYFVSLKKVYIELQNDEMHCIINDALEALYQCKTQNDYFINMFGDLKEKGNKNE